jgi:hypothetical protein
MELNAFSETLRYCKNLALENRNVLFYNIPHRIYVNAEIVMDQFIPHPSNLFPGDVRVLFFQRF